MMRFLLIGILLALPSCASTVSSEEIRTDLSAGTPVNGIPFRVRDRLTLELYKKSEKGYELVNTQLATMADPGKLYVLNFSGQMLADASVKFEQLADGSLSTVKVGSTPKATEAVTGIAAGVDTFVATDTALKAAKKAAADKEKADAAAALATATAATDAAAAQNLSAAELIYAAQVLELQLAELPAEAKPSERRALEGQVAAAKLRAKTAAAKAGLDDPFP